MTSSAITGSTMSAETILHHGKIATNGIPSTVEAVAISDGKIAAAGTNDEILLRRGPGTKVIDLHGRTVIPGLIDSHIHAIRAPRRESGADPQTAW